MFSAHQYTYQDRIIFSSTSFSSFTIVNNLCEKTIIYISGVNTLLANLSPLSDLIIISKIIIIMEIGIKRLDRVQNIFQSTKLWAIIKITENVQIFKWVSCFVKITWYSVLFAFVRSLEKGLWTLGSSIRQRCTTLRNKMTPLDKNDLLHFSKLVLSEGVQHFWGDYHNSVEISTNVKIDQ